MDEDAFPVRWTGRRVIVGFPANVDVSNAGQLRDRLLALIKRGVGVLIADMTQTVSCDHAAMDALARGCQQAAVSGTQVRLVVTAPAVRRVLGIEGLDRLVSIYPAVEAAVADIPAPLLARPSARAGPGTRAAGPGTQAAASPTPEQAPAVLWRVIDALGDGLALTDHDGAIVLVNRRCAELFGYKREEMTGLPVEALVPVDVRAAHRGYRAGYHRLPHARPMAERARLAGLRKDGATFPVEIGLSPVPTASDDYILAVVRDATDARPRGDLADLARSTACGPPRLDLDLLDRMVSSLFQVGLSLQAAAGLPADVVRQRLADALDQLDDVILRIRDYAFTSGEGGYGEGGHGEGERGGGEYPAAPGAEWPLS